MIIFSELLHEGCRSKDLDKRLKGTIIFETLLFKNFVELSCEELHLVRDWRNSDHVRLWSLNEGCIPWEEHLQFIESLKRDHHRFYYLVLNENEALGVVNLTNLDIENKRAYWGIYTSPQRISPHSSESIKDAFLKLAFQSIELNTLKLEVLETNQRAIRFYHRSGFTEEGRLRNFIVREGAFQDMIVMGMLREEYMTLEIEKKRIYVENQRSMDRSRSTGIHRS